MSEGTASVRGEEAAAGRVLQVSLDALAGQANEHHRGVQSAVKRGLAHALAAGAALNAAKARFPDKYSLVYVVGGTWTEWMRNSLDFHVTTAHWYMRIDHFRDELAEANIDSFKGAMKFLRQHELRVREMLSAEDIEELYAALDAGRTQTEMARELGISKQAVSHHVARRRRGPTADRRTKPRIPITDEIMERVARWLVERFGDSGYFPRITEQVRQDARELLILILVPLADQPQRRLTAPPNSTPGAPS